MLLRLLIISPLLLVLVLFALSNTGPVRLGLWPTDYAIEAPLSLAVLGAMAVAFVLGGVLVWINELGQRRRASRAERNTRQLEDQVNDLKSRLPAPAHSPPGA